MPTTESTSSERKIKSIIRYLKDQRGFDFQGYRDAMLERRIQKRIQSTKCLNLDDYYSYLRFHSDELDHLIDVLTINVSHFFRNSLSFEYIRRIILPELIIKKTKSEDTNIRIWSAGCSFGEEAYTMAILINEFFKKEENHFSLNVFATDIDKKALIKASEGCYDYNSIKNVKYHILKKYFSTQGDQFKIDSEIKKMVQFSFYDMLDKKRLVPPESIFGNFDLVLCRNVMIYFDLDYQIEIFEKLYQSLKPNGYLILGESEIPMNKFKHQFKRENKACKIYKKIS